MAFRSKSFPQISSKSYRHNAVSSRFSSHLSTSPTNAATFVSRGCGGHTLGFAQRIAHNGTHGETGGLPFCEHSVALRCQRNTFYSTVLLYTYISRFSVNPHYQQKRNIRQSCRHKFYPQPLFIVFFNFLHKRPTFAFTSESGYTLGFRRKIAHKGTHGETGGVLGGGWYHYPRSVPHVSETLRGRGLKRQTLPLLGLGRGCSQRTQRAFGTAMRLCASLSRRRRGPAGLRDLFRFCRNCGLYALRSGPFRVCEARGGITTLSALYALLKRRTAACQNGSFAVF